MRLTIEPSDRQVTLGVKMGKNRDIEELTTQAQAAFLKWKDGIALKAIMIPGNVHRRPGQERSFYRYKAEILEVLGVDIANTVREQMGELASVKYHGEYLLRRDSPLCFSKVFKSGGNRAKCSKRLRNVLS